jgi:hypothetical protein
MIGPLEWAVSERDNVLGLDMLLGRYTPHDSTGQFVRPRKTIVPLQWSQQSKPKIAVNVVKLRNYP